MLPATDPTFERTAQVSLQMSGQTPRVWLEGKYLARAGFVPGAAVSIEYGTGGVTVRLDETGERCVSVKRGAPLIDINNSTLGEVFGAAGDALEVHTRHREIRIRPIRTRRQRDARVRDGTVGEVFAGGGLLGEAFRQAGYKGRFAVEVEPRYAEVYADNHPDVTLFNMPVEEVPEEALRALPVEVLAAGIPCPPYSKARQHGRERARPPEAHELGHMTFWTLKLVDLSNPYSVVIENVPGYLESGSYWVLRGALEAMRYWVDARVLDAADYGGHTRRRRAVVLAHTDPVVRWPLPTDPPGRLGDLLEPAETLEEAWFDRTDENKAWLFRHWERQRAKGNGFVSEVLDEETRRVPTITKRYLAGQGDNPVVAHPDRPETYRWLTLGELKRLHGLAEAYDLGPAKTRAGEMIGQGVDVTLFRRIALALKEEGAYEEVDLREGEHGRVEIDRPGPEQADLFSGGASA